MQILLTFLNVNLRPYFLNKLFILNLVDFSLFMISYLQLILHSFKQRSKLAITCAVLEITVSHRTLSDQICATVRPILRYDWTSWPRTKMT